MDGMVKPRNKRQAIKEKRQDRRNKGKAQQTGTRDERHGKKRVLFRRSSSFHNLMFKPRAVLSVGQGSWGPSAICCLLSVICHLLSVIGHLPPAICYLFFAICYLLSAVYHLLSAICSLLLSIDPSIHLSLRSSIDLSIDRLSIFSCLAWRCMVLCRCGQLHSVHRPVAVRSLGPSSQL